MEDSTERLTHSRVNFTGFKVSFKFKVDDYYLLYSFVLFFL